VNEVKSKVLGIAVVFLAIAILATPVLAVSPTSVPALLTINTAKVNNTPPEWMKATEGGIIQQRGIIRTVDFDISEPGSTLTIGADTYVVAIHAVVDITINSKTTQMINHYHKWTITLPVQEGLDEEGMFMGTNIWSLSTDPTLSFTGHAVLQGSGAFEGQTLKLSVDFPPSPNFMGYLMP